MSQYKLKLPDCPTCGSHRYRKTGLGFYLCEEGHQLEGYREEIVDYFEDGFVGAKVRRIKKEKKQVNFSKIYTGEKGKLFYLRSYQLILKKQSEALIKYGAPETLLTIVKDLWKTYISINPYIQINIKKLKEEEEKQIKKQQEIDLEGEIDEIEKERTFWNTLMESDSEEGEGNDLMETDLADLEDADTDEPESPVKKTLDIKLYWSLVLQYLALTYLKFPIMSIELLKLTHNNLIPYKNARNLLPIKHQQRLKPTMAFLSLVPSYKFFHKAVNLMSGLLFPALKLSTPSIPVTIVSFSILNHFKLTDKLYPLILCLMNRINLETNLPISNRYKKQKYSPESLIVALIIVILKCIYGLDGRDRIKPEMFNDLPDIYTLLDQFKSINDKYFYNIIPSNFRLNMQTLRYQPLKVYEHMDKVVLRRVITRRKDHEQLKEEFKKISDKNSTKLEDFSIQLLKQYQIPTNQKLKIQQNTQLKCAQQYLCYHEFDIRDGIQLSPDYLLLLKYFADYVTDGDWSYLNEAVRVIEKLIIETLNK